ncbi:MAG TPA: aldolase/citrate lyase family protein [Vineibacter sp.]|nr:aldolase/citrate lyase family protein [Vineibacter sp.]
MRDNTVKKIWAAGDAVVNGWLGIPSSVSAENMAQAGWDSLTVDLQHGVVDYQAAVGMMQAVCTTATMPLCRVPWNEPGIIMKMLDAGAMGVICPMINSRAECEAFVGACRYAPVGYRSVGPNRAAWWSGADYLKEANGQIATMAMIETRKALDNLDDILSVPGVDGIYVGPADLGLSLGKEARADHADPFMVDTIKGILATAKKHKVYAGLHCASTAYARQAIGWGYQFVTILADNALLMTAAKQAVAEMRAGAAAASKPTGPY